MVDVSAVGSRIRQCRKLKGLTQEDLASRVGLSTMSIRRYESGDRLISEKNLQRIADALGVHVLDLMGVGDQLDKYRVEAILPGGEKLPMTENVREIFDSLSKEHRAEIWKILKPVVETPSLPSKARLDAAYAKLNPTGQQVAVERVEELTEIPRYQKEQSPSEAPPEGKK